MHFGLMNIEYLAEISDDNLDEKDNAPFPIVVNNNSQLTWFRVYAQTSVKKVKYLDELYERSQIPLKRYFHKRNGRRNYGE